MPETILQALNLLVKTDFVSFNKLVYKSDRESQKTKNMNLQYIRLGSL